MARTRTEVALKFPTATEAEAEANPGLSAAEVEAVNALTDHTYAEDGKEGRPRASSGIVAGGKPVDIAALVAEANAPAPEPEG